MNTQTPTRAASTNHVREIQISDWRPREKNTLRGFFTATLPSGMIIHDLALHEKGNRQWINTPVREYTDKQGQKQYSAIIEFTDEETGVRFSGNMLAALNRYFAEAKR